MASLFGNKKLNAVGLDISESSIKLLGLKRHEQSLIPDVFVDMPLPPKIIVNHMIVHEDRLADRIGYAWAKAGKIDTRYVVACLPEGKSFVRTLTLSNMSDDEINGAIPWELEQDIPVAVNQVYLDWQKISETPGQTTVLVAATVKDYVDALIEALRLAKLQPLALELESQAVARALIGPEDAHGVVLVLDLASRQTSFIIVNKGILEYTSSIGVGGADITQNIAQGLGVGAAEAEKLKREMGLLSEVKQRDVRKMILPVLDKIVEEIKNVIRYYEEREVGRKPGLGLAGPARRVGRVVLAGGSAQLSGIADYLSARLNLGSAKPAYQVQLGNPLTNLHIDKLARDRGLNPTQALSFATAIGLAIRGAT